MVRLWRFAFALFLVPVVIFTTPTTAQALPVWQSDWAGADFAITAGFGPDVLTGGDATCEGSFSMRRDSLGQFYLRAGAGFCRAGVDTSLIACQVYEPDCTSYSFTFQGPNCSPVTLAPATRTIASDSSWSIRSGWSATEALAGTCDPTHVCINVVREGWGADEWLQNCTAVELDPEGVAVDPALTCQGVTVEKPTLTTPVYKQSKTGEYSWYWWRDVKFDTSSKPPGESWTAYVILGAATAKTSGTPLTNETLPVGAVKQLTVFGVNDDGETSVNLTLNAGTFDADPTTLPTWDIIGAGYIRNSVLEAGGSHSLAPNALKLPQASAAAGLIGVHDSTRCSAYWGTKIATITANTTDDPPSDLFYPADTEPPATTPPVTDPGADEVDDSSPDTELGFWKSILAILRQIWNAISGLASSIVGGVTGALSTLFIPDSVDLMDDVEQTKDAWSQSSVSTWSAAVTGQSFSMPSSGCGGIPVDLVLPGDVAVNMDLGASCSGSIATAAGVVKAISTGATIVFGGLACMRALGSGFGWNPGIATKGAA